MYLGRQKRFYDSYYKNFHSRIHHSLLMGRMVKPSKKKSILNKPHLNHFYKRVKQFQEKSGNFHNLASLNVNFYQIFLFALEKAIEEKYRNLER